MKILLLEDDGTVIEEVTVIDKLNPDWENLEDDNLYLDSDTGSILGDIARKLVRIQAAALKEKKS